jgi:hypothetical protein
MCFKTKAFVKIPFLPPKRLLKAESAPFLKRWINFTEEIPNMAHSYNPCKPKAGMIMGQTLAPFSKTPH